MALIVVNVELQSALERKKYKVIIPLEFKGENWVKLSIHISKVKELLVEGPMDLIAQFTISHQKRWSK